MKKQNSISFEKLIDEMIGQYKNEFETRLSLHRYPIKLLTEESDKIEGQISFVHNSNSTLNTIYFELYNKSENNRNLDHCTLCEEYCKQNKTLNKDSESFFTKLFFLYKIKDWLHELKHRLEEEEKERIEELKEQNEGEFTLTRRILALQFLIKTAGKEIRFGEMGVNKTKIAEFIDFLVSKETKPKEIRDSSVHTRLKNIWDKENKAHHENLNYIREQFNNLGLSNIVKQVDKIIQTQQSKE